MRYEGKNLGCQRDFESCGKRFIPRRKDKNRDYKELLLRKQQEEG